MKFILELKEDDLITKKPNKGDKNSAPVKAADIQIINEKVKQNISINQLYKITVDIVDC